jgi:hypothetical protein
MQASVVFFSAHNVARILRIDRRYWARQEAGLLRISVSKICITIFLTLLSQPVFCQSLADESNASGGESIQSGTGSESTVKHYRELSFIGAQSFSNPQVMSDFGGQRLTLVDFRLTSRLWTTRHLYIGGDVDVKPLALHSRNTPSGREYTYGGGGGIGLQFAPRTVLHWQPYFDVDGGLLAFTHDVPKPDTRRVNMTLDFGPGVLIPFQGNNALRTGVWFFHFSNGNTAPRNPAFDGFMIYVSYTYRNFAPHLHHKRAS